MPVIRHKQERDFCSIPNHLIRDERLHMRDVGLLAFMLSLPSNWSFSVAGLCAVLPHEGRDGIKASLKRIEKAGYLHRVQLRGEDGKLGESVWTITDVPCTEKPLTAEPLTANTQEKKYRLDKKQTERNYMRGDFYDGQSVSRSSRKTAGARKEWDGLDLYDV